MSHPKREPFTPGYTMKPSADSPLALRLRPGSTAAALALLFAWQLACGDDDGAALVIADAGTMDAGAGTGGSGGTAGAGSGLPGGAIPAPPDGAVPPSITVDADYATEPGCCTMELSLADSTGDETVARLMGSRPPLDGPGGLPLTYSDGRWRAAICVPFETQLTYRFYFGTKLVPPAQPDDAGVDPDGGADANEHPDADVDPDADGDAGLAADPGPGQPDAMLATVEDYRTSEQAPVQFDLEGNGHNWLAPVVSCTPPPPEGPPPPKE